MLQQHPILGKSIPRVTDEGVTSPEPGSLLSAEACWGRIYTRTVVLWAVSGESFRLSS